MRTAADRKAEAARYQQQSEESSSLYSQIAREQSMYGCSVSMLRDGVADRVAFGGAAMVVAGMMSDAQEEMAQGRTERARQTLNSAKWVISEYLTLRR